MPDGSTRIHWVLDEEPEQKPTPVCDEEFPDNEYRSGRARVLERRKK
jgi:hypothetical protein